MIKRTKDYSLINSILTNPAIYETITQDGASPASEYKTPEDDAVYYLLVEEEGEPIGLYIVHRDSMVSHKVHANILTEYRPKYSNKSAQDLIEWVFSNTDIVKLNAEIPYKYQNVISFTEKAGFTIEGIRRHAYLKDGVVYDVALLGLMKGDWL